ncbi:MAG TPA: ATP-binding cassette domain-containing protein [Terriglobia bacterium]|nr:ATP-binding cassette domain-containing protein [Terriglobia bacterium]
MSLNPSREDSTVAVAAQGVTKKFDPVVAVNKLDLCIKAGALFGILGPNGAGKTTTLRMIMRMLIPDEGTLRVFGQALSDSVQDMIGYLPEERGLYPRMKVLDVLVFLGGLKGLVEADARVRAQKWLHRLEIGGWAEKNVIDLSKGMQQKVQFIGAVLHAPRLLILDEPFTGLDPVNAAIIKDIMMETRDQGATIILSSHRMEQVEMMCEDICLIDKGKKVLDGNLKEIKRQYGKNTLRLEYSGDGDFLEQPKLIEKVNRFGSTVEAKLIPGADPQEILKLAVARGVRIHRFELMEPPLNDIFIEKVSESRA